jgi:hypothetical protein
MTSGSTNKGTMKSFIATIALFTVLAVGIVHAQHVNIGIKGGLNAYNLSNNDGGEFDTKLGGHFGLLGHVHMASQFGLQPEIVFSMQGAKSTVGDAKLNLNYVNVPVLLQYMFNNGFRLQAGPQIGFLMSAKAENGSSVDVKDSFNNLDLGLSFGASYVQPSTGFGFDVRYNHGMSDIAESSLVETFNRGFQVGVFYLIKHRN